MDGLRRVFFHELGHFIALEISTEGDSPIESIKLIPHPIYKSHYTGDTKVSRELPRTLDQLPANLANYLYGCIFQSYHLGNNLRDCFGQGKHGKDDSDKWYAMLFEHKLHGADFDFQVTEDEFYNLLINDKILDEIAETDHLKYLLPLENGEFEIDLSLVRKDFAKFIEKHKLIFNILLEKYKAVIGISL